MLPSATATELNGLGHDGSSVVDAGLIGAADDVIYVTAVEQRRVVVIESFADLATLGEDRMARQEPGTPVVFVRKRDFPRGGGLATHLARRLHQWAADNPDAYPGPHWRPGFHRSSVDPLEQRPPNQRRHGTQLRHHRGSHSLALRTSPSRRCSVPT